MIIKNKVKNSAVKEIYKLEVMQGQLKKLSDDNKKKLKASILKYGFSMPLFLWAGHDRILDGTQRLIVIKELLEEGHTLETGDSLPIVEIEADNEKQAAELILAISSQFGLITEDNLVDFIKRFELNVEDLEKITTMPNIDMGNIMFDSEDGIDAEAIPEVPAEPKSKEGEVWTMGNHRIMCGDTTSKEHMAKLMKGAKADMVMTDPPYNLAWETNFDVLKNDKLSKADYQTFLSGSLDNIIANSKDTASYYVCIDYRSYPVLYQTIQARGLDIMNCIVWDKVFAGLGFRYRSRHEFIIFAGDKDKIVWNGDTGTENVIKISRTDQQGRRNLDLKGFCIPVNDGFVRIKKEKDAGKRVPILDEDNIEFSVKNQDQTDVWEGFSMNSFTQREKESIDGIEHLTIKPIKMLMDFIVNSSKMGDIILDTFSGSGSTIMAAEKTRRTCYAMELDPRYVDVALRRYAKYTGQEPVREADGKKWSEL